MNKFQHIAFSKRWNITPEISYILGQCKTLTRAISDTPIQPEYHQRLLNLSLIKGAQATTAIEGNTLSHEEIQKIQSGEKLPPSKEYQEIEVKNILDAFNKFLNDVTVKNSIQYITPSLIKDMHKLIGVNLGKHLDAIPGQFREDSRIVGSYRCPDHRDIKEYMTSLCQWLVKEFNFGKDNSFKTTVIQAIVTHIYIEWIHPFGDGNGRTGRLAEFYILLRSGLPNIATHILSNYYNLTRPEYYRQLENARVKNDLTEFIHYAVLGFRDGLNETLGSIRKSQFDIHWKYFIYETFKNVAYRKKDAFKRKRDLMLDFPIHSELRLEDIEEISPAIARHYVKITEVTLKRDLKELVEMGLLIKNRGTYRANTEILKAFTPVKRPDPDLNY
ncbi:MAG: Fic family protein [Proteobacteria bacterium]|nr:Fic family protein [Pseudomonadota bacterium]